MIATIVILVALILIWPIETFAYIGPGMGVGVIATALGFVGAVFLGLVAFLYYPIRRLIKNKKKEKTQSLEDETENDGQDREDV